MREETDVFCIDSDDIGNVTEGKMKIQLKNQTPVQKTYYFMLKPLHLEVKHYIEHLLNKGWITKSTWICYSSIFAVQKKDGSLRLDCDYWSLNSKTQVDRHSLSRIQDVVDSLKGKNYFSVHDQQKVYHQTYLDAESRPLTAFINQWDLYEWVRVLFGLTNAPAEFKRFMGNTFFGMRDEFTFPYLDDTLVFSDTLDDHLNHLKKVFKRLREKGIKIKSGKCKLFQLSSPLSGEGY